MKYLFYLLLIFYTASVVYGQQYTIHGYVRDQSNGEALIGASVLLKNTRTGTVTNLYGFYSLSLSKGEYTLVFSYVGFNDIEKQIILSEDINLTVELTSTTEDIDEVVVMAKAKNQNVVSTEMGVEKLNSKTIERIPVIFGEADVIKALKLTPGVISTSETSSSISVRGGTRDQNLILLDEASVYNASHLLGLFSVFNNDAIKSVEMYKGMIPASYGGRISSVIDIRMKEGDLKKFSGIGSVGLLTSRLTLQTPIVKDKGSILISGRRTYLDLLTKGLKKVNNKVEEVPYYFYDFNVKGNYTINDKHRVYLSGYFGRDISNLNPTERSSYKIQWGNYTTTLRWNYIISNQLFANVTFLASDYKYLIESKSTYGSDNKSQSFKWEANLKDYGAKVDFSYFLNNKNSVKFGVSSIYHDFMVGKVNANIDTIKYDYQLPKYHCLENAVYTGNVYKLHPKLTLEYGLRLSTSHNIGKSTIYKIEDYNVVDTLEYKKNEVFNTYYGLEPRFSAACIINSKNSLKFGYSRTFQYVHIASNSNAGTPLDIWMPVTPNVKPQFANQWTAGYFRNFFDHKLETSVEVYYKHMNNQIEFKEFSNPYLNPKIEEDFRFGEGRAYGVEFMIRKNEGRFNGWVSYTISKSERKTKNMQEKDWYPSPYDQRHNLSVVGMYNITKRISVSANWVYLSGKPFNAPSARYEYGNLILPYYVGKNASRYPNYHRLDLGLKIKNKPIRRFQSSWTFSVYNAYNRKNANMIYFEPDDNNTTKAYKYSLLQRIYSVSFNFNF